MDYRPIALLNAGYKVFTRAPTTRVRDTLEDRIHPHQTGFVPGRTIHDTIHLLEAAQASVQAGGQTNGVVLLLDFRKAYDSLSRRFLNLTLERHGYPPQFVNMVSALNEGTTVSFLANGHRSRRVHVASGIRRG
eukprot:jgi/Phyca11/133044/e_gw1.305.7.1